MTAPTLPPRRRTRCSECDRRRLCYDVAVRLTDRTLPLCDECVFILGNRGAFA